MNRKVLLILGLINVVYIYRKIFVGGLNRETTDGMYYYKKLIFCRYFCAFALQTFQQSTCMTEIIKRLNNE